MAQERSLTPEKQLLRLIEDSKINDGGSRLQAAKIKHKGFSLFSLRAINGRLSFIIDDWKKNIQEGRLHLNVRIINNILGLGVFILTFYLIGNFFISTIRLNKMPDLKLQMEKNVQLNFQAASLLKVLPYYLEKVRGRDIFKMVSKKTDTSGEEKQDADAKAPSAKIAEATQHLRLAGISWSDDPDVMIEDTKTQKTHFLKKGQRIDSVKIQAVFKDKVILSYEGEEIELR